LAISDYNKAIEINPRFGKAYYYRAITYYHKKEYNTAWQDLYKSQSLGYQVPLEFLEKLREASGREE